MVGAVNVGLTGHWEDIGSAVRRSSQVLCNIPKWKSREFTLRNDPVHPFLPTIASAARFD